MADEVDVVIEAGSSNFAGFLALLDDVPLADLTRWLGASGAHPPIPSTSAQRPYESHIPGARILTPRRPYSNNVSRVITASASTTTVGYLNIGSPSASAKQDSWVYIRTNSTGQGNFRKLSALATTVLATVTAPWSPTVAADGTIHFLLDSHTTETHTVGTFDSTTGISGNTITVTAHGLKSGDQITITGTVGATGLALNTTYYIINPTVDTFQVSRSPGGAAVALTSGGGATLTVLTNSTSTVLFKTNLTDAITSAATANGGRHVLVLGAMQTFTATANFGAAFPNTVIRAAAHGLAANTKLRVVSTTTLPGGLAADTDYYVRTAHSFTVVANDTLHAVAHGFVNGARVRASGVTGLTAGIDYFIVTASADDFKVSLTSGGTAVAFTPVAGTFTFTTLDDFKLTTTAGGSTLISFANNGAGTHTFQFYDDTIRKVTAFTATSITLDVAMTPPPPGSCFCILSGANSCESLAGLAEPANSVLQDLTFYLDQNAPVYLTGLDYQNFDTTPFQNPRTAYGTAGTNVNLTPELTFQLRARLDSLVTIKMGVSASMISQFLNGTVFAPSPIIPFGGFIGWFHDILSLDFHPSSPSALYVALTTQITVTKALVAAEGKVAKFRGIFINIWDNDPADAQRVLRLRANTELFIASLRNFIGDQTVPVSLSGPSRYGGTDAQREIIYEMGVQLVENETNAGLVDTRVGFTYPTDYAIDGLHYAASGQIKLAQGHFAVWDTVQTLGLTNNAVDICNLALSHIGESSKVTSLDTTVDLSTQARHCARFYPRAVGFLLEQHDWGFNTRRKPLVLNTNPSASLLVQTAEWDFAYDLPNLPHNFATSIAVLPPGSSRDAPTQPYEIETDLAGHKLLLTDVEDAVLRYTVKVSNPQRFSESFIQAAAWMLASMLAGPIVKGAEGKKAAADCLLMMQTFLRKAEAHDSNQKKTDHEVEAPWMPGGEMPGWPARWDPNAHG